MLTLILFFLFLLQSVVFVSFCCSQEKTTFYDNKMRANIYIHIRKELRIYVCVFYGFKSTWVC